MTTDLKSMSDKQLNKLRTNIDKELSRRKSATKSQARKAVAAVAKKHGFSLGDLVGGGAPSTKKRVTKPKKKVAPKYRNPADASQTWTGRGRQPLWFKEATDAGAAPETLAI